MILGGFLWHLIALPANLLTNPSSVSCALMLKTWQRMCHRVSLYHSSVWYYGTWFGDEPGVYRGGIQYFMLGMGHRHYVRAVTSAKFVRWLRGRSSSRKVSDCDLWLMSLRQNHRLGPWHSFTFVSFANDSLPWGLGQETHLHFFISALLWTLGTGWYLAGSFLMQGVMGIEGV